MGVVVRHLLHDDGIERRLCRHLLEGGATNRSKSPAPAVIHFLFCRQLVFSNSDFVVLLVILLTYIFASVSFCFLISSLCNSSELKDQITNQLN